MNQRLSAKKRVKLGMELKKQSTEHNKPNYIIYKELIIGKN